jgi:predicted nucleotidyltransferase
MFIKTDGPTPFPEVSAILQELLESAQSILGGSFVGMYLEGSLALGDFDQDSDIDFVVVTDDDVSGNFFSELRAMHERIAMMYSRWAIPLEGSYISQYALRRHDSEHALHPHIERGNGKHLQMVDHDETWIIHRYILREHGIAIIGPSLKTLIDPVSPNELRQAILPGLHDRAMQILNHPNEIIDPGHQSHTVLSLCRTLYTLQFGDIVSKPKAMKWAKETTGGKWNALIDQAWKGRHSPQSTANTDDMNQTLELIRYALEYSQQFKISSVP